MEMKSVLSVYDENGNKIPIPVVSAKPHEARWRLIETIELTEAAAINRDREPDGRPYAFKGMALKYFIPQHTYTQDPVIGFLCTASENAASKTKVIYMYRPAAAYWTEKQICAHCTVMLENGWWNLRVVSPNATPYAGFAGVYEQTYDEFMQHSEAYAGAINKLQSTYDPFPAGTKMEIWGLDT